MRDLVREDQEHQLRLSMLRGQPLELGIDPDTVDVNEDLGAVSVGPDKDFDKGKDVAGPWGDGPRKRTVRREPRGGKG